MSDRADRLYGVDDGLTKGRLYRLLEAAGVKDVVLRRGLRNMPRGAIRFPALVMRGGKPDPGELEAEVAAVRRDLGLSDLMIVIGAAFEVSRRGVLLVGPPGIGKSTAMARLSRVHEAKVLDDDCVLVGIDVEDGRPVAIETGAYNREKEFVQRQLRTLMGHRSPCLIPRSSDPKAQALRKKRIQQADRIALWSAAGSIVLTTLYPRPWKRGFAPRRVPIAQAVYCLGPRDPVPPLLFPVGEEPRAGSAEEAKAMLRSAEMHELALPDPEVREKLASLLGAIARELRAP